MNIKVANTGNAEECWALRNEAIRFGCKGSYSDEVISAWTSDLMPDGFRELMTKEFFSSGKMMKERSSLPHSLTWPPTL
ncbi:TPA: hypothetical protein ACNV1I_005934 [Klebsiella oxytoca]|uniref:hypothetical protein n=1 Tax=Klebsiella oxytoca TaxID=571 RepID=UPI0022471038|nr:hypothetical protein [Klebsiella oxytoca]